MTGNNVHFLIMNENKEKTVSNPCTDFGLEHGLLLHCVLPSAKNSAQNG